MASTLKVLLLLWMKTRSPDLITVAASSAVTRFILTLTRPPLIGLSSSRPFSSLRLAPI